MLRIPIFLAKKESTWFLKRERERVDMAKEEAVWPWKSLALLVDPP
jgi:hypothetical protein